MTLDDLRNENTVIDATKGKVEAPEVSPVKEFENSNPIFSTNDGVRGVGNYTPTVDNLPPTPLKTNILTAPVNLNEAIEFDPNTLPKRPPEKNELEEDLMSKLDIAVEREMEDIGKRMDAVKEKQYEEFLEQKQREAAEQEASIPDDLNLIEGEDDPETELVITGNNPEENVEVRSEVIIIDPSTIQESPSEYISYDDDDEDEVEGEEDNEDDEENNDDNDNDNVVEEVELETVVEEDSGTGEEIIVPDEETEVVEEEGQDNVPAGFLSIDEDEMAKDLKAETSNISDDEVNEEAMLDELKTAVKSSLKTKKKLDLSAFSVAKTPVAASKALSFSMKDLNVADWALPNAKCAITVSGLSGPEIFSMDPSNSNRNRLNTFKDIYSTIYRHVVSENKGSFEKWMKTTRYSDIQHIYFALYRATFYSSNFIHYECPHCHHVFIKDLGFDELVEYKNDEVKTEIKNIMEGRVYNPKPYPIIRYQVSDRYVVDIKEPSVWATVIELSSLSEQFLEKYDDLINTIIAIDKIYVIDYDNTQLVPIDPKPVKGNIVQTIANKVQVYSDIIRKIPSDAYFELRTKIAEVYTSNDDIQYVVPSATCPKCSTPIAKTNREASELLFTRHQLGALQAM